MRYQNLIPPAKGRFMPIKTKNVNQSKASLKGAKKKGLNTLKYEVIKIYQNNWE